MTQTLETGKKTTLSKVLNPADTVIDVATAPTVTKGRVYLFNGQQEERCSYNGVVGNQLQNVVRNLSTTAIPATAGTGLKWIAGTRVKFVAMHDQLVDRGEDIDFAWAISFSKSIRYPVYATTAARDVAIPSPANGMVVYVTADGVNYQYIGGAWTGFATGTTPNASPTVAGKVEAPTLAQQQNGDTIGETWALLFSTPDYVKTVNDAATAAALQIKTKLDVASATTANITLSGIQTIDGVAGAAAQRVLVKAQTSWAENGIWLQNAGSWTRATDFDANTNNEVDLGASIWVQGGTVNAGTMRTMTTTGPITVGTTAISFARTYPNTDVSCRLVPTAGTSISFTSWGSIAFASEDYDTNGFHDNVTNNSRITIPTGQAGKYIVTGCVGLNNNFKNIRILKNWTTTVAQTGIGDWGTTGGVTVPATWNISRVLNLAVGDYVELQAYNSAWTSQSTDTTITSFDIQKIA